MDTKIVLPFLKFTGQESKEEIDIIKKTIEILTEFGDKDSIEIVKNFRDANKNLPKEINKSLDNGFDYYIKKMERIKREQAPKS